MVQNTSKNKGLPAERLRIECNPASLGFKTTETLKPTSALIGQDRATEAIKLSAQIESKDFNIYVLGNQGTGRHGAVDHLLSKATASRPIPCDWVYVNNFDTPHKPLAMKIDPGAAASFKKAMQQLVDDLANEIPALFDSEDYQTQRRAIEEEFGQRHEEPIAEFAETAKAENIALLRTPMGFLLAAIGGDGKPMNADAFENLPTNARTEIENKIESLQKQLADVLQRGPQLEKEHRERISDLHALMAERAVSLRVSEVNEQFKNQDNISDYLECVRKDMISNAELFLVSLKNGDADSPFPEVIRKFHRDPHFDRYAVNVMVSHNGEENTSAPIIKEELPTLSHLTGRIEHVSQMGTLATNFTLIKPGALHRANGGYIVLDAHRLLSEPYAWDALKQCLHSQSIAITSLSERLSLSSTTTLEPEPIPLDVRVILIGDRRLHMLLQLLDPEFGQLFKLQADFEDDLARTAKNTRSFAQSIASYGAQKNVRHMTCEAVAALLDYSVRLADDSKKLSLALGPLFDAMQEADFYATQDKRDLISDADIYRAIERAEYRASRIKERMHDAVMRKTILIDTSGTAKGQVNALSVYTIGNHSFGRPSRITSNVRMGAGKLIDIEREVELGGPLHSKGVLILSSYLASNYALDVPMSLHASLVFEQNYGGIDGDSASCAELYALLSALSGIPIQQGLAVTGSVNQNGEVQAVGGVNEKIESFFDLCKDRGFTGDQGVLIPASNVEHLMLRRDVVAAAKAGDFKVIPVKSINQGIEILTGVKAGRRAKNTIFPKGSVNALVEDRLRSFAKTRRRFIAKNTNTNAKEVSQ